MHENHRQRMLERAMKNGFDSFHDHEILEMLLYHSIPRADTNPIAHELLERFGRFDLVLEASGDEMKDIKGMGDRSAFLLHLIRESARRYTKAVIQTGKCFDNIKAIAEYANACFVGTTCEHLYMFLFNNKMEMIDSILLSVGSVNSAEIPSRIMLEKAIFKKASCVVLAHNHPHGTAVPSDCDIDMTYRVAEIFELVNIPLLEHLIIAENRFVCIMKNNYRLHNTLSSLPKNTFLIDMKNFLNVEGNNYLFDDPFELAKPSTKED